MLDLKLKTSNTRLLFGVIIIFFIQFLYLNQTPFFWDAVSKAVRAKWFYDTNFSQFVLPVELNSGHPPLWPLMLSSWWKIFGVSLLSSRFLLLIINILVGFQIIKLFKNIFPKKEHTILLFIVFLEPTFLAQTTILNNDMLMLLFTLIAFNSIAYSTKKNEILLTIALTGILFSNLRGMLLFLCLGTIHLLFVYFKLKKVKHSIFPYIISVILFIIFLIYQYVTLGWVIKTPSLNWASHRSVAEFPHILKNIASVVRNFIDYGRIIILVLTFYLLYKYLEINSLRASVSVFKLTISILVFSIGMSLFFIFFTNPIGHRYYMISYILIVLLLLFLINDLKLGGYNLKKLNIVIVIAFVTGHFWIYPSTISQGWDSSLAYLKYFKLRDKVELYIEDNNLNKNEIGTNLPLNRMQYSDLDFTINASNYSKLDLCLNKYVLLSNIENETSDEAIRTIFKNWILVKKYNNLGVYISLYKKPN